MSTIDPVELLKPAEPVTPVPQLLASHSTNVNAPLLEAWNPFPGDAVTLTRSQYTSDVEVVADRAPLDGTVAVPLCCISRFFSFMKPLGTATNAESDTVDVSVATPPSPAVDV